MQRIPFISIAASVLVASGCSLVIDVPANCSDSDCAPYVCEPDGVACRDACTMDSHCGSGFVCDPDVGECLSTGCRPLGEPVLLAGLPPTMSEFAIAVGGSPEQLLVVASRREGLGFMRFNIGGESVPDPIDSDLGLVRFADANYQRLPYIPRVRYADGSLTEGDGGTPRFIVSWRSATQDGESLRVGTFVVNPATAPSSRVLLQERSHVGIADQDFVPDGVGLASAWRATSGQVSEVRFLQSDVRGDAGAATPRTLSAEEVVAGAPAMGTFASLTFVGHTLTGDGARRLVATVLDDLGTTQGTVLLVDDRPASAFDVEDLAFVSTSEGVVVAWGQPGSEGASVYAALIGFDALDALDPIRETDVPPFQVGADWSGKHDVRITTDGDGYAIGWVGEQRGRSDIWVQRLETSAAATGAALPVTDGAGAQVAEYRIAETADGLAVAWLVEGSSAAGADPEDRVFYRRFVCDD